MREYKICQNCVMDTSDSKISFDSEEVCDHCHDYHTHVKPYWHTDVRGRRALEKIVTEIKRVGKGQDFDCILGMSGGADSSYMLHKMVSDFGVRPLVFHVDGGWNSDVAVSNINSMIDKLGLDLFTEVINWNEMRDFQLSFFKSGLPFIDLPQDHAFMAVLYQFSEQYGIKFILNGGNYSTECVRNPLEYFYYGTDMPLINDVIKRFGTVSLKTYPFSGILRHKVYLRYVKGVRVIKPLNYMPYVKREAVRLLHGTYGWRDPGQKHFESRFTRFYEGYWLPRKFGFDTRRVQYSSLVLTGQMSREEALVNLEKPALLEEEARVEFSYIASKLEINESELRHYFDAPNKTHRDYQNQEWLFNLGAKALRFFGADKSIKR